MINHLNRRQLFHAKEADKKARQQVEIDKRMGADECLSSGLRRKIYTYAWDEGHSGGFDDVAGIYENILEIAICAQMEGTSIVLGGP